MKKSMIICAILLLSLVTAIGCKSAASNCFTRNGSRTPVSTNSMSGTNQALVSPPTYPMENVIYAAPTAGSCAPCTPNACTPVSGACDPCGANTTGASYPQSVLPGIN